MDLQLDVEFLLVHPSASAGGSVRSNKMDVELELDEDMMDVGMDTDRDGKDFLLPRVEQKFEDLMGTTFEGKKIVWRRKNVEKRIRAEADATSLAELSRSFLTDQIHRLINTTKKQIDREKLQRQNSPTVTSPRHEPAHSSLWTDKYRPSKFLDLMGDDRTHRNALTWLKSWDACVFPSKISKEGRAAKRLKTGHGFSGTMEDKDEWKRPREKVLLLTGPPGVGKTTLAQIVAHAAGYRILEINASDDRSYNTVVGLIKGAVEHTGIGRVQEDGKVTNENRPVCVIIDEIDGAGGGGGGENSFMKALINLISSGERTNVKNKNKKSTPPLLRPLICICNDLYTPILRPLRPFCKILRFTPPTNTMLVKRLSIVCEREDIKFEQKGLRELVEGVSGDLRGAMNCLQLLKKERKVDQPTVKRVVKELGGKDSGTTHMAVWEKIFRVKRQKLETDEKYFNEVSRLVSTCGEYEKLALGCFEYYPRFHHHSSSFTEEVCNAMDWLAFFDSLDSRIRVQRDYELSSYIPYAFTAWYPIFGSAKAFGSDGIRLEWPKEDYQVYLKRMAHEEISTTFRQNLPVEIQWIFTAMNTSLELAPFMMRILSPDLKPLNSQVIKAEEKVLMKKLVDTMSKMKLYFVQERNEDGQLFYKLDPPIDLFIHYDGKRAEDVPPSRYGVRQLVAREMDAENIRRTGGGTDDGNVHSIFDAYKKQKTTAVQQSKEVIVKDFFGRPIVKHAIPVTESEINLPPSLQKSKIKKEGKECLYKYHEGFSNAVRLPRLIEEFF